MTESNGLQVLEKRVVIQGSIEIFTIGKCYTGFDTNALANPVSHDHFFDRSTTIGIRDAGEALSGRSQNSIAKGIPIDVVRATP